MSKFKEDVLYLGQSYEKGKEYDLSDDLKQALSPFLEDAPTKGKKASKASPEEERKEEYFGDSSGHEIPADDTKSTK